MKAPIRAPFLLPPPSRGTLRLPMPGRFRPNRFIPRLPARANPAPSAPTEQKYRQQEPACGICRPERDCRPPRSRTATCSSHAFPARVELRFHPHAPPKQKAELIKFGFCRFGARGGIRTHTGFNSHKALNLACLPISPPERYCEIRWWNIPTPGWWCKR